MSDIISKTAQKRRTYWIEELQKLSGSFGTDTTKLAEKLEKEFNRFGVAALIDHLRLCGSIPESYSHDIVRKNFIPNTLIIYYPLHSDILD